MRIGIVSDIHANLPAFVRVMTKLAEYGATAHLWCIGDVVGYGPHPNECLDLLREHEHLCVPGNHDWGTIGRTDPGLFNDIALWALNWTKARLSAGNHAYLEALPMTIPLRDQPFTLVHGSPRDPIWEYLVESEEAAPNFPLFTTPYCLVGHTHLPRIFRHHADGTVTARQPQAGELLPLGPDRLIINPGSVGQPRDGDPRAHYAVLDTTAGTILFDRVEYPVVLTQARMRDWGFPAGLIARLEIGV
ncbi:MAG TPA: metallophosphoesterase family protein [Chloroflexia bacterium]|nr:metallophosphoesterase family protein [Chloroflexia bacterium]